MPEKDRDVFQMEEEIERLGREIEWKEGTRHQNTNSLCPLPYLYSVTCEWFYKKGQNQRHVGKGETSWRREKMK